MTTTTKDSAPLSSLANSGTPADQKLGLSSRTDATGVEIPVIIHASRYSPPGEDASKALPALHEQTRTVVVFPQGCVVHLSARLSVGELIVLTNQQSGTDVLCRVTSCKSQPGLHNYIDLEFTQRVPGFWDKGSLAGRPARSETVASESAAPGLGAETTARPPAEQVSSLLPSKLGSLSPSPASTRVPDRAPRVIRIAAPTAQSAAPVAASSPTIAIVPSPARAVQGLPSQPSQPDDLVAGSPEAWVEETWKSSRKRFRAAAITVVFLGLLTGTYLLTHRGPSSSPVASVASVAPVAPLTPAPVNRIVVAPRGAIEPSIAPQPADTLSAARPAAVTAAGPVASTEPPKVVNPAAATPPETSAEAVDAARLPASKPDAELPPQPRNREIAFGKLSSPVARRAAISSSSEPPPVLLTQGAAPGNVLGTSLLAGGPGGQLQQPKLLSSPAPIYPAFARSVQAEGTVVLDVLVDETGKVTQVKVISGPIPLQQAAMTAIRQWKYQPARLNGQPIAIHTNANISFSLR